MTEAYSRASSTRRTSCLKGCLLDNLLLTADVEIDLPVGQNGALLHTHEHDQTRLVWYA